MMRKFTRQALTGFLALLLLAGVSSVVHAQACLGPGEQRKAINNGNAQPFGNIASRIGGELAGARLCKQGRRLIYIVTVLNGNKRIDAVFDAKSGKRLR